MRIASKTEHVKVFSRISSLEYQWLFSLAQPFTAGSDHEGIKKPDLWGFRHIAVPGPNARKRLTLDLRSAQTADENLPT